MTGLRAFLVAWQFWGLELLFAVVVITTTIEVRRLALKTPLVIGALALAVGAAVLAASLPPRTSRIYYDEQIYQGIARNLSDQHLAQLCNDGSVEYGRLTCLRGEYNKQPYGFPYLVSIAYRLFGVNDTAAFTINNLMAALAVLVTVALMESLFTAGWGSLLAGALIALFPMQLAWSNTAAAEPSAAAFCGAALLATVHYARRRTGSALAWAVALSAFAMTLRPEGILVVPLAALVVVLLAPDELRRARLWVGAAGGVVAAAVPMLHLAAVRNEGWGTEGSRMSWANAQINAPVNTWFYLADERFPALVGLVAIAGLLSLDRVRERLLLGAFFAAFWLVFVFFYAGSYNYGADVRYSLMTYIPVACLAALGIMRVAAWLNARWPRPWIGAAVTAVVLLPMINYWPLVRATGEEAWAARADEAFAKELVPMLPRNSIVLTHNPHMFHVWGKSAAQLSIAATDHSYINQHLMARYAGGVYLHWNFWCNVADPIQQQFCRTALSLYSHDLVAERHERDYAYALYRLRPLAD